MIGEAAQNIILKIGFCVIKAPFLLLFLFIAGFRTAWAQTEIQMLHLQMGGSYHHFFINELESNPTATGEIVKVRLLPVPLSAFHITKYNWDFSEDQPTPDLNFFKNRNAAGQAPDFMIISGHHIPGIGWHSDDSNPNDEEFYARSLRLDSLLKLREESAEARNYFDHVKFVFISGCWGLANLEPHDETGQLMAILTRNILYNSGLKEREQVTGLPHNPYTVTAQKFELTTLYDGDFAANPKDEKCKDKGCSTYYINRVMPESGLLDNSHKYNEPYQLKKLFPKAFLIFGFHSPSPYNDKVMSLIAESLTKARGDTQLKPEDQIYLPNLIQSIISENTPIETKKRLIKSFREAWTTTTWEKNQGYMPKNYFGGRPAASITPAFPDLDNDGVFAWPKDYPKVPAFAPRCLQYRNDTKVCKP